MSGGAITGKRRPDTHNTGPTSQNHFPATVTPIDHFNNAAVAVESHAPVIKRIVDEVGAPALTYVGYAAPGTALSAALWRIQRITEAASITTIEYAVTPAPGDGDDPDRYALFDKVWDDRASYTYG